MEPPSTSPRDDEDIIIDDVVRATRALRPRPGRAPRVDVGDDGAVLADGTAVTVDALVQGVHWDDRLSPEDLGFKALAVSVSDLAAMGARPGWAVLTLACPVPDRAWTQAFARGLAEACARWDVALVGGDTVRTTGPIVVSLTLGGACVGAPLVRTGARPGDDLWVTGTLGLAGLGWRDAAPPPEALAALRRPDPPLDFALAVATRGLASAAMDLSDGLAVDLPRLCSASGVGAVVDPSALPGHPALGTTPLVHQVCGGEDYQLLLAAPASARSALLALAQEHDVRLSRIGAVEPGERARLRDHAWPRGSFSHFAGAREAT